MGMYGNGITFEQACTYDKQRIKAALEGFDLNIDTGEKHPISKEEARGIIISAYDEAVYQGINSMKGGRALDAMLKKRGANYSSTFKEYMETLNGLEQIGEPYKFDSDVDED